MNRVGHELIADLLVGTGARITEEAPAEGTEIRYIDVEAPSTEAIRAAVDVLRGGSLLVDRVDGLVLDIAAETPRYPTLYIRGFERATRGYPREVLYMEDIASVTPAPSNQVY